MLASMATYPPVTLVVGEEEFLVDRAVRQAVAQARAALAAEAGGGDGGGDLHDLEASALGQGEINALTSPSLFGGGSTVIVRNAQNAAKDIAAELTRYAAAPAPDAAVILTHAGGVKGKALVTDLAKAGANAVSCPKLTRVSERTDFVRQEFRRVGRQADEGAVRALLDAIGGDLRELASAVDQLASDTEGRIGSAVVARYYRGRAEATGFSVADHAVEGRLNEALEQLRWALATGTAPVLITSALATGVRLLGRVGAAPAGRQRQRARGRGRRPAVEDRPGPPAAARLAPGRRRTRAAGRGGGGRAGQGRRRQPRVRPRAGDQADCRLPGQRRPLVPGHAKRAGHSQRASGASADRSTSGGARTGGDGPERPSSGGAEARPELGELLGDRRLAVRGLVLVDDALGHGLVELARGDLHRGGRVLDVAGLDGLAELPHVGAELRLDGLVALVRLLVLS